MIDARKIETESIIFYVVTVYKTKNLILGFIKKNAFVKYVSLLDHTSITQAIFLVHFGSTMAVFSSSFSLS